MKRNIFILISLLIITNSFAQREINNVITDNHQLVKGTKYLLVPPDNFLPSNNFHGFQQSYNGASILLLVMPGPFSETTEGFTEEGLKTQGVILKEKEKIKVNGQQGLLLTTEQIANGIIFKKYILTFGDSKSTTIINGTFPKEIKNLGSNILKSMYSVVYDKSILVTPLSTSKYYIETKDTKLKLAQNLSGMLVYTVDGNIPTKSVDKTAFAIGESLGKVDIIDEKQASIDRLKKMPYKDIKIDDTKVLPIKVAGLSGYEIIAEGYTNTKKIIYQVMLYTDKGYYIMVGTSENEFQQNIDLFKKIVTSFRIK